MTVWCVYNVSDVSLKTHMGGCGGGVCWYSAMVTSPYSAPPRPPSALTSFHTWELLCLQLEYFTRTGLQCVCLCGIRISNAFFVLYHTMPGDPSTSMWVIRDNSTFPQHNSHVWWGIGVSRKLSLGNYCTVGKISGEFAKKTKWSVLHQQWSLWSLFTQWSNN